MAKSDEWGHPTGPRLPRLFWHQTAALLPTLPAAKQALALWWRFWLVWLGWTAFSLFCLVLKWLLKKGKERKGRQRGGVTDIVNSCLHPSNTSLWIFLSFLCLFNKELTSQGQILKNIHYFFFLLFPFLIVILLWRLLRSKFKPHEGTAAWSFCVFFF